MGTKKRRGDDINVGDVFDDLTVIKIYDFSVVYRNVTKNKPTFLRYCRYKCKCGRESNVTCEKFIRYKDQGKVNRCPSCAYRTRPQSTIRASKEERYYKLAIVDRCNKSNNRIKNKLSLKDFKELIKNNCHYCGQEPEYKSYIRNNKYAKSEHLYANGVDRLNSDGDYEIGNVVTCCKTCNVMKGTLDISQFLLKIKSIYELNNLDTGPDVDVTCKKSKGTEYDAWVMEEVDDTKENPSKEGSKRRKVK